MINYIMWSSKKKKKKKYCSLRKSCNMLMYTRSVSGSSPLNCANCSLYDLRSSPLNVLSSMSLHGHHLHGCLSIGKWNWYHQLWVGYSCQILYLKNFSGMNKICVVFSVVNLHFYLHLFPGAFFTSLLLWFYWACFPWPVTLGLFEQPTGYQTFIITLFLNFLLLQKACHFTNCSSSEIMCLSEMEALSLYLFPESGQNTCRCWWVLEKENQMLSQPEGCSINFSCWELLDLRRCCWEGSFLSINAKWIRTLVTEELTRTWDATAKHWKFK